MTISIKEKNAKTNKKKNKQKGKLMSTISKMSRGFMLPISLLPIAGLLLGIGGSITGYPNMQLNNPGAYAFGSILSAGGDVVFSNLPILFSIALAITFTKDAGGSALTATVGYLIFNAFQQAFIQVSDTSDGKATILWFIDAPQGLISTNLGITSMQTSVFGGILIGALSAFLYNKFSTKKLPGVFSFFSGVRLVPILTFIAVFPVAILFLLIWPWIAIGLSWFGQNSAKAPIGLDSFAYGFFERMLLPFGLHHVWYLPLWQTAAGGTLNMSTHAISAGDLHIHNEVVAVTTSTTWGEVLKQVKLTAKDWNGGNVVGDQNLWMASYKVGVNFVDLKNLFGINVGRFMQNYPIYIAGLPAACAAMYFCADSKNKKQALSILATAAGTSLITGITEPVEYTFLFVAPALFWGFHAPMSGLSAMLLNVSGAHIGVTFSSGLLDLIIYGVIPVQNGTHFWWAFVIALAYIPIYFFSFLFIIKKFNIQTPGRGDMVIQMKSKKDYKNKKDKNKHEEVDDVLNFLGGFENIKNVEACATRLRVDIVDREKVSEKGLKSIGAMGIVWTTPNHIQVIYGGKAEIFANQIKNLR